MRLSGLDGAASAMQPPDGAADEEVRRAVQYAERQAALRTLTTPVSRYIDHAAEHGPDRSAVATSMDPVQHPYPRVYSDTPIDRYLSETGEAGPEEAADGDVRDAIQALELAATTRRSEGTVPAAYRAACRSER